jgi:hypothetical protein
MVVSTTSNKGSAKSTADQYEATLKRVMTCHQLQIQIKHDGGQRKDYDPDHQNPPPTQGSGKNEERTETEQSVRGLPTC